MRNIVIMPGGFHPFHAGHAALYKSAVDAFNNADVYVAATNDTKTRPFPFAIKEKLAKLAGVADKHFVQVKSPFKAEEITSHYNPNEDVLIFVRSEKDKTEQPKPGGTKKDGSPAYFQPYTGKNLQPFNKHAYIAYLPTVEFGPGIKSATEIRNAWPNLDDRRKTAMVMSLYPVTQKNPKLAANVVKMLDMGMGGQQTVAEGQNMPDANGNYKFHMFAYLRNGDIKEFNVIANGDRNAKILAKKKLIEKGYTNIYSIDIQGMSPVHGPVNYAIDRRLKLEQQEVATGSDGWIGNPTKWKEAVLQAHGPDVAFKNYSHPGQPGKRSIHAWDSNGKIVGVYQRHNKMGMVQPNMQGVSEGLSKRDQQDVAAIKAAIERLQAQLSHPNADRDAIQQSIAHEKKRLALYGVAEESLNEFAVDGFGDSGDNRSKLLASVGRLLDGGNKVDWQVPGQMGHVTRVQNDGITMKRWKMPHSRMSFFLPMYDDSRDNKYTIKMVAPKHYAVVSAEQNVTEGTGLSVEQLAHISDKALDDAYHYGRSTPGANFGWMANLQSAKAAKKLIDAGETDIETISDAIHKGWNITAAADYKGQLQLDTPTPDEKKLKRAKLAMQSYSQLPEEEKEKDRVVARAMLAALGKTNVSESADYLDEK